MPFRFASKPRVSRPLPEPGGDLTLSFEVAAIGDDTHVMVTYEIVAEHPYLFVPPACPVAARQIATGPHPVGTAPTPIVLPINVEKTPPGPPRFEQVFIEIEVAEVDAAGNPAIAPGGIAIPPRRRTAAVTII
jgi:hypothetical protein